LNDIPISKWRRSIAGGKTAVKVSGKALQYFTKKPFLSRSGKQQAKEDFSKQSAEILFNGMSLLKGTALKIAQQLSIELELFPPEVRKEMEKSYNQVPPINQALIRKIIKNAFGHMPEEVFESFDSKAFAAASLGQVHRALSKTGRQLAVKVQYPGIRTTIKNDIQLVRSMIWPLPEYHLIQPALQEIEARLVEETDYIREADHVLFFGKHLHIDQVRIPDVDVDVTTDSVLSTTYMDGDPLNIWLKKSPPRKLKNKVAQFLHDIFIQGLYELHTIHADPNPGNFIIQDDSTIGLTLGLIDFGCVKQLDSQFVNNYRQLVQLASSNDRDAYFYLLRQLNLISSELLPEIEEKLYQLFYRVSRWFGRLFEKKVFDFSVEKDFMKTGWELSQSVYQLRQHMDFNPNFIFLDRTRYGLLRLFERMEAKVRIRNPYEWPE